MGEFFIHFLNVTKLVVPVKPEIEDERLYPDVDVFIATYNESEELLYKTIIGCKNMHYPDLNKVHIYLLDDGRRPTIKQLAKRLGVGYLTRDNNEHAKAGNLKSCTESNVITVCRDTGCRHDSNEKLFNGEFTVFY